MAKNRYGSKGTVLVSEDVALDVATGQMYERSQPAQNTPRPAFVTDTSTTNDGCFGALVGVVLLIAQAVTNG